jgi:hypothetical protein
MLTKQCTPSWRPCRISLYHIARANRVIASVMPHTEKRLHLDWYDLTAKYHQLAITHSGNLESLPEEWQRELASMWRLEADINNGGYLQFLGNWGVGSHKYALAALRKMQAKTMAKIIADSYAKLKSAVDIDTLDRAQLQSLIPNPVIDLKGNAVKKAGSPLSDKLIETVNDLSSEFMDYADDVPALGIMYYSKFTS